MRRLSKFIRDVWIKAQLLAPPWAQQTIMPRLHEAKEIIRLLVRPFLPIYQLQGQGQGGPLTVTYVGLDYAKPDLKNLLFIEEPVEQKVGRIPFWRCQKLTDLEGSDIIIVSATKHLIYRLCRQNAIVLPEYVHHILNVQGDWPEVCNRFRRTTRKNELRWMHKYGYHYELSCNQQHFEEFYHSMYLPTMIDRHNQLAQPMSIDQAYQYFQQGLLFQVKREGDWVSGVVCHPQGPTLMFDIVGVKNADVRLIHEGATAATYYVAIHWANEHHYEAINFLGTNPYLGKGAFQHKRKWGASITISPHLHRRIWIKVNHDTPAVSQFLKENSSIIVDREENLHGLITVDDVNNVTPEDLAEWKKLYATPGLKSLIIRPVSHFIQKPTNAAYSDLIIPISSEISEDGE